MEVIDVISQALIAHGTAVTMALGGALALVGIYLKRRKSKK